jgi:hypothetical protein
LRVVKVCISTRRRIPHPLLRRLKCALLTPVNAFAVLGQASCPARDGESLSQFDSTLVRGF